MKNLLLSSLLLISSYSFAATSPTLPSLESKSSDPVIMNVYMNNLKYSITLNEYINSPAYEANFILYRDDAEINRIYTRFISGIPFNVSSFVTIPYIKSVTRMDDQQGTLISEEDNVYSGTNLQVFIKEGANKNEVAFTVDYKIVNIIGFKNFEKKDLNLNLPETEEKYINQSGQTILGEELKLATWPEIGKKSKIILKMKINKLN